MAIMASIWNLFKRKNTPFESNQDYQKTADPDGRTNDTDRDKAIEPDAGFDFLDGMSTGTARFIIDREISSELLEKYNIKDLENKGRYYIAKIVNQDGEVADTVLIDKLNRSIHFQKTKLK